MHLFFTDATFVWQGFTRPDLPFLCDKNMELVSAPNAYLRFIGTVKGKTRSPKTWRTYANHLYEYFTFLELNNLNWKDVSLSSLATWRDTMLSRGCSRSTVNQRLRCIADYYTWAVQSTLIEKSPMSVESVRTSKHRGLLTHIDSSGRRVEANILTTQTHTSPPKFLLLGQAIDFIEALSPHLLKLMGYLALLTGLRREELTCLVYKVFPNPCGQDPNKQLPMILDEKFTPTKGAKTRTVMIPYDLAVALWNYFCLDWPKRHALHVRKHKRESLNFFLSEYGDELSIRYLNNAFSKASKKTGIPCHPHMLRHTFGTYEFLRMSEKMGRDRALLWLRERMGHSSITTTEMYIHTADLIENREVDEYQRNVMEKISNGY